MPGELQVESAHQKADFFLRVSALLSPAHRNFLSFRREVQAYYRAKIFQKKAALPTFLSENQQSRRDMQLMHFSFIPPAAQSRQAAPARCESPVRD